LHLKGDEQMSLAKLRADLAEKKAALPALKDRALAENATAEDTTALTKALDEIEVVEARIVAAEKAERVIAEKAVPASDPIKPTVPATPAQKLQTKDKVGLVLVSMVKAKVDHDSRSPRTVLDVMDKDGFGEVAAEFDMAQKTMASTSGAAGAFNIPQGFAEEIIGLLTPYTAFLRGDPTIIPMPSGNFRQAAGATRPIAGYRTENTDIANSTATLREIDMSARILSSLVPLTDQIVRWTSGRAQAYASGQLGVAMGLALDDGMLLGNGTSPNPRGILNIVGRGTRAAAAGTTPTQVVVDAALRSMLNPIESFAELQNGLAWLMPQRVIGYLTDLRTPGGENYAYPSMQGENPTLKGYPVLKASALPINGGAGTNEARIGLVSFSNIFMGESQGMSLSISDTATYVNGGTTISAFQRGLVLIRATMEHDVEAVYNEAVQELTAVQWGA
jgi:HK97 family phage major capsid protein